ncbi:hypothetical protein HAP94_21815 [Acidithiobacillus ferrivorans]|uniref:Uncharacterized protein n=1 Tax=mine drainage metagenome TaxID=410659 RepID=E6QJF8_9ZZZZ|nr:hypothetical protein [Acidithiobacillus ferrivorans]
MSTRITLRIGNTTPDDLEIQRFLRMLEQKNLSRQGWMKHAMILGFAQLEKEIGSTDARDGGQHDSGLAAGRGAPGRGAPVTGGRHSPRKTPLNTHGQQGSGERHGSDAQEVSGEWQTENGVEPNHNGTWTPPVQTHSPQPVPVSSTPAQPAQPLAGVQPTPFLQPQPQLQGVSRSHESSQGVSPGVTAAPESSGNTKTTLVQGATLLTDEEMRFSSTAVEQARKLMGSFGKGYDG